MNTASQPMHEWKDINWRKLERIIFKLRKQIYKASNRGDVKLVRRLQKLLIKSWGAIEKWLSDIGLELKPTDILPTLISDEI
jgi:hypothetical protein